MNEMAEEENKMLHRHLITYLWKTVNRGGGGRSNIYMPP